MAAFTIRLFCFFSLITSTLAMYHPSYAVQDHMGRAEKANMMNMCAELVKEAMLRMRQIIEIREEHDVLISYNIGMIMGRIREKYRTMDETYRDIRDGYNAIPWHRPPGIGTYRSLHFLVALQRLHYLELEIDKLVDVLLEEASGDLNSNRAVVGQTDPPPHTMSDRETQLSDFDHTKLYMLRSQNETKKEEALKSDMRQRFLMKKLGNPINMTTPKKRFLRKWPVEDSWSLDKYNHDYK